MKVLVVGGSGYLGGAIARDLSDAGTEVLSLSRSGRARSGWPVVGDVTKPSLALGGDELEAIRRTVTHIVSCAGSVTWELGPREANEIHQRGTAAVFELARSCQRLEKVVHVSSILALGRAKGLMGNRELFVGQRFRNWYEYGKYLSEHEARQAATDVPTCVIRFGPLLGTAQPGLLSMSSGITATLPVLLQGYPIHLAQGGEFPCYVGEVATAAVVVRRLLEGPDSPPVSTWFDPDLPTLRQVLFDLCRPWGVVPRIVDLPGLKLMVGPIARRIGLPRALLDYTTPWLDLDLGVLDELPGGAPPCPPDYVVASGHELRHGAVAPRIAAGLAAGAGR